MPTETLAADARPAWRRWWPEAMLAALAVAVFLGCLGSVDLWGKREQRVSAEAIDTIDHHHWLVAQIQGRPRLEKPPLPRWLTAGLMALTGRRDEWMVRFPGAVSALATVALVYLLGRRIGGRPLGQASALVLCSFGFFAGEMRQAGNDALLALFTTLALYAAWRRLHDEVASPGGVEDRDRFAPRRIWSLAFHVALGLGFMTKGPIILLLVGLTMIPYLAHSGRLKWGLSRLADPWGLLLFTAIAASWPVAVLREDPNALRVWLLEMSEKTGMWQVLPHRRRVALAELWPGMVLPWTPIAVVAAVLPFLPQPVGADRVVARGAGARWSSPLWFPWWWAVGSLVMFSLWANAKPNYYVPCVPGMALLVGTAWIRLGRSARGQGRRALASRLILQAQWVLIFVAASVTPLAARAWLPPAAWAWTLAIALAMIVSVVASVVAWRRGADVLCLAPITASWALGVLVAYGIIAPGENALRSHRTLAEALHRHVPPHVRTLMFFNEIDEGLWFYLNGLELAPVPGTQPGYNTAYDLAAAYLDQPDPYETLDVLDARRRARVRRRLIDWLDRGSSSSPYLLIRNDHYESLADELGGRVTPLYREAGMKRGGVTLLQVGRQHPLTATTTSPTRR